MGRRKKQQKKSKPEARRRQDTPAKIPAAAPIKPPSSPVDTGPKHGPALESAVEQHRGAEAPARRSKAVALVAFFVFAVLVPAYWFVFLRDDADGRPRLSTVVGADYSYEDYASAESCEECHETQYQSWLTSTHGRAGGNPTRDLIIARSDGRPIRFADAVVYPLVGVDSAYLFVVEQDGYAPDTLTISGVIGGGHMYGGGTQGFVSELSDGTVRFLPFDFIRHEDLWFCNTNTRSDKGWIPI